MKSAVIGPPFSVAASVSLAMAIAGGAGCSAKTIPTAEGPRAGGGGDLAYAVASEIDQATKSRKQTIFGWDLHVSSDHWHFRHCTDADRCDDRIVDVPATSVKGMKIVGHTHPSVKTPDTSAEANIIRFTIDPGVETTRGGAVVDPNRGIVYGPR